MANKSDLKKVLIIVYYWPPSGGSGVQRWVKFVKYLREFGWEPIVYTPSNPERPAIDKSLSHDLPPQLTVLTQPIWEPYTVYKKIVGLKKDNKLGAAMMKSGEERSVLNKLSVWVRGNFFIPDARKFWIRPSVKFLTNYLSQHSIDAIISTGPPHSMHLIAEKIVRNSSIPWLADFRDPWTNIDFFEDLQLTPIARQKHHQLEKKVLDRCDQLVVISPTMKTEFKEITDTPISVIPNGFDADDFPPYSYTANSFCTISHVGMMTPTRNPEILWKALQQLSSNEPGFKERFKLQLVGSIDAGVRAQILKYGLESMVILKEYVPHTKIIPIQQSSEALLLIINNTPNAALILTGKLFEYLAAQRPIICISPILGDAAEVIDQTGAGEVVLYNELEKLKEVLKETFERWKTQQITTKESKADIYSRKKLTYSLSHLLNKISNS